jgi:hypothetical protein
MLLHFQRSPINSPFEYSDDLLNLVVPTSLAAVKFGWTETISAAFRGNTAENGAYVGIPLLAIIAWFGWARRKSREARFILFVLLVGVVFELGPRLEVHGRHHGNLPWRALVHLPVLDNVLPARFSVYVALATAVVAALWIRDVQRRATRVLLPLLAVAALVPAFWQSAWHWHPYRPPFVTTAAYRRVIPRGATVLILPYPIYADSMLWQAESGFRYRLADGALNPLVPPHVADNPFTGYLLSNDQPPNAQSVIDYAKAHGASIVVVEYVSADPYWTVLNPVFHSPLDDGVFVYRLR